MAKWAKAVAGSMALVGGLISSGGTAIASAASSGADTAAVCPAPPSGYARCGAVQLLHPSQSWHPGPRSGAPGGGSATVAAPSSGFYPADLQSAYGLAAAEGTAAKTGPGPGAPTIAVVDAYDDPYAASDLSAYRSALSGATDQSTGLTDASIPPLCTTTGQTQCVTFKKVNQSGGTSYPRGNTSWAEEISLDLDMASAICPECNIVLVEASSATFSNLQTAVAYAKTLNPVAVTNSYGGSEFSSETSYNSTYGYGSSTAVTASTGDSGYGVEFPAAAPNVTAVGGTSLDYTGAGSTISWTQSVWSGAGAGCSAYESEPSWQSSYIQPSVCSNRTVGDISAVADPYTGVAVYDTYGQSGWLVFGGTSVSAQVVGAMYGLAALGGSVQPAPSALYASAAGNVSPVTSGSDGSCGGTYLCDASASVNGYNGPTGLGTPVGVGAFTGAPAAPGFTLSASPTSATVTAGTPASYTVTVNPSGGYTGTVSLSATGCPDGNCTFSPTSVDTATGPYTSTLTVPTSTSDTSSPYTITIAGSDGTLSSNTSVTLTVNPQATTGTIGVTITEGTVAKKGPNYHVPLTVAATDGSGNPLSGASVALTVYSGSCSAPGGAVSSGSGTTGNNGQVTFTFSTRTVATYCAVATVSDTGYQSGTGQTTFNS